MTIIIIIMIIIARCSNENMKDTGGHLHLKVIDNHCHHQNHHYHYHDFSHDHDNDDDDGQVLGWGLLSENGDQPSVLQKAKVPFLPYGGDHLSDDHGDNDCGHHGDNGYRSDHN